MNDRETARDLSKRLEKAYGEIAELKSELALRWETIETYIEENANLKRFIEEKFMDTAEFKVEYEAWLDDLIRREEGE